MVQVVPGFSKTNRWLLYTSLMLSPAQFMSGIGSISPSSLGFLAYNWYNQYVWYTAAKAKDLHALSLLPVHFNFIYAITYLAGVSSGSIVLALPLGFGTAGLLILNTITAWTSWATNLPEGYDVYQFFFFGWRTLTPGWRTFFLLWQIGDTFLAISSTIAAIGLSVQAVAGMDDDGPGLGAVYLATLWGPVAVLGFTWELIMWVELIVSRNDIESETDMVAVWLFVAQVVLMLIPDPWTIAKALAAVLWYTARALVLAPFLALSWIVSTLKRIPHAMGNLWTQSKSSNALPEHGRSEESAVIKLEEGRQQHSNELSKHDSPETPAVIQLEGAQQNKAVLPEYSPLDPSPDVQLEKGAQQNSDVSPEHGSPEASATVQLEGPQQNSSVLPGPSEVSVVQLEQEAPQNPSEAVDSRPDHREES